VTAFRSGIGWQLLELDGYFCGWSPGKVGKEDNNEVCIVELGDKDKEQEKGQGDSSSEEEKESETGEARDVHIADKEGYKQSAVVRTQQAYNFVDDSWTRMKQVTSGDDNRAHIMEDILEVSMSVSHQEKWNIWKVVAFSKKPAKADPIEKTTPNTPKLLKMPQRKAPAMDTRNYEVLGISKLDYTMQAHQERETGEFIYQLLPKVNTASVSNDKQVTARNPAAPRIFGIPHISAFSGLNHHAEYTEFWYTRASPTVLGKIHWHKLPMLIDGRSEMCVISDEVTSKLNIGWKHATRKMITADVNQSDLTTVAESMPVNVNGITIPGHNVLAKFWSEQFILGHPWVTCAQKCERNQDDGSCEITISLINRPEQVTFVTTWLEDKRDRFASCSGNLYT